MDATVLKKPAPPSPPGPTSIAAATDASLEPDDSDIRVVGVDGPGPSSARGGGASPVLSFLCSLLLVAASALGACCCPPPPPVGAPPRRHFYLHPEKPTRLFWDIIGVWMVIWVTMSLPFRLAFLTDAINERDPWFGWSLFVDAFFCADIVFNFYTAYYDEDTLVTDAASIKWHYLRTFFLIDFLGAVPFDYIVAVMQGSYLSAIQATHALRVVRLLRLFRLLKISNLYRFLGRYEERISVNAIKLFKLVSTLLLWLHLDACIFFLVARWHELETGEWAPDSWVVMCGLVHAPVSVQYFYALWHVAGHMVSISYGVFTPVRLEECVMTLLSVLAGAVLYAGIIGTTASVIQNSDLAGTEYYRQWDELKVGSARLGWSVRNRAPTHTRDYPHVAPPSLSHPAPTQYPLTHTLTGVHAPPQRAARAAGQAAALLCCAVGGPQDLPGGTHPARVARAVRAVAALRGGGVAMCHPTAAGGRGGGLCGRPGAPPGLAAHLRRRAHRG